jgi:radical SAM superfamily enzyme YgiQ (UPF0313 family)
MAAYRLLFDGMLAASQTTTLPRVAVEALLMPRDRTPGLRARIAPLGLRRVEAALLAAGLGADDVIVVREEHLREVIGPRTRLVAISSGEPCGLGMNTSTMTTINGGMIYPQAMFRRVLAEVHRCLALTPSSAKVLLGGPGAWQLAGDATARHAMGIDHVVNGYCEGNVAALCRALVAGEALPEVITGEAVSAAAIPPIRGATTMGVVEISRGCGLGCSFCTIARTPMLHLPEATILADVRSNLAGGNQNIAILSEDFLRYGAQGLSVNPAALISLLHALRHLDGLRLIQVDHVNVASIARYRDEELQAVHNGLVGGVRHNYPWVNIGVETASGALLKAAGGGAKFGGIDPNDWGAACAEQVRRMSQAGFFPLVSLVVGLPGEGADDVRKTLAWVEALRGERLAIFPVLYAPIDGGPGLGVRDLTRLHWQLIKTAYAFNFRWTPHMYWDNQTGAGETLAKRLLMQAMGQGQVVQLSALMAWHAWRARA